jgi:F0F1-type ATP synthase assembly protein I
MAITCPANDTTGVCATMDSAGAGLGVFIQYMGQALPLLLIILAMVGIIVAIGFGIAHVVKKSVQGSVRTR